MPADLQVYYARDRRVYDGALSTDMQKEADHTRSLFERLKKTAPETTCVYFPGEERWMTFLNYRPITGNFHNHKQEALIEAIKLLEKPDVD